MELFKKGSIVGRTFVLVVFTVVALVSMIIAFLGIRHFGSKDDLVTDTPPTTRQTSYQSASSVDHEEAVADPSVVEQEPAGTEQEEVTAQELEESLAFLDALEKAEEQTSTGLETERTEEVDVISPEHLRIGMILNPDTDIAGARYATVTDPLGRTLYIPTNLPDGYRACSLGSESGSVVMIVPADGNYMAIQVNCEKDGVSEFAPPELAWELYQEDKSLRERLESLPQGSEGWHEAKADRDRFIEKYGSLESHIVKCGSGYPIIVYGLDGEGGYRSIVNP